jgi:hypothetical protein
MHLFFKYLGVDELADRMLLDKFLSSYVHCTYDVTFSCNCSQYQI